MTATAEKTETKTLKVPQNLTRAASVVEMTGEGDSKSFKVSISSDTPYLRYDWWDDEEYYEVLSHAPEDIKDGRLKAGLPSLYNHQRNFHLGRARAFENDGKKLTVSDIVWSEDPASQLKKKDIDGGVLVDTSVGYELIGDGECVGAKDGIPIYKFKWEPHEFSFVTIAADYTVGAGRASREHKPEGEPREISIRSKISLANNQSPLNKKNLSMNTAELSPEQAAELEKAKKEAATTGVAAYKAKCKEITDYVGALKNPAWQKAAEKVAKKHLALDDPDFTAFLKEANLDFNSDVKVDPPEGEEERSSGRFEVLSKRGERTGLSIGAQFVRSKGAQECKGRLQKGHSVSLEIPNIYTLGIKGKIAMSQRAGFTSSDLSAVNQTVDPGILMLGTQRLTIMDVIGSGTIGTGSYKYARENGFGTVNGVAVAAGAMPRATAVGERGLKPTWEPDLSTETANVKKIAVVTKVPDEFLADFPSAMSYIDDRLPLMVDTETEYQILYGDGLNDNLKGIFATSGVQTRAIVTTDDSTIAGSLRQGLTDIQVGAFFEPDFYGFHPYDWETAQLLKDTNKRFFAGGPYYVPYTDGLFQERHTFWGKPVVISTAISYGYPIAGAGKIGAAALIREGMRIEMTNSNENDFIRNLVALRAEHRLALPVYRPVAFVQFTGFPARA